MRPVRFIRDEHDCRTWAIEAGLTVNKEPMVTCGGGLPGDPNGELSALPVADLVAMVARLRGAATMARAALSDLLTTRDPKVYSDALRALDEALGPNGKVSR